MPVGADATGAASERVKTPVAHARPLREMSFARIR